LPSGALSELVEQYLPAVQDVHADADSHSHADTYADSYPDSGCRLPGWLCDRERLGERFCHQPHDHEPRDSRLDHVDDDLRFRW
jgi:hypothetical protein